MGHYQGDIALGVVREFLHEGGEGRPGCYMDTTVDLEVKEVGALEYMVFIPNRAAGEEAAGAVLSGGIIVVGKFDIQAVV